MYIYDKNTFLNLQFLEVHVHVYMYTYTSHCDPDNACKHITYRSNGYNIHVVYPDQHYTRTQTVD